MSQEQIADILTELREQRAILMGLRDELSTTAEANRGHDKDVITLTRRVEKLEETSSVLVNKEELEALTGQVEGLKRAVYGAIALAAVGMPVALSVLNKWLGNL
jgi:hypothetical protein